MSPDARRELEAVDAALAGAAIAPENAALAQLTLTLRDLRPSPAPDFTRALDARAAGGFRGERRRRTRGATATAGGRRAIGAGLGRPALGAGLAVVVAVALVLGLALPGAHRPGPTSHALPAPVLGASGQAQAGRAGAELGTPAKGAASAAGASVPPAGEAFGAERQVERTSTLDIGLPARSIQSAAQRVFSLVSAYGGYVAQSSVSSGQEGGASFDARVPAGNLAGAIAALSHLGHVRSETDTTNDVTDRYDALRRSLGDARAERASLLKQLAAAGSSAQAASIAARLRAVEARIAGLQGALRALTNRIDYTPLALSLTPERAPAASSGGLTPGGAAGDAARVLDAALAVLVIAAAAALPIALVGLAAWGALALTRRRLREQALDANP
jgi:hypothetical protein